MRLCWLLKEREGRGGAVVLVQVELKEEEAALRGEAEEGGGAVGAGGGGGGDDDTVWGWNRGRWC